MKKFNLLFTVITLFTGVICKANAQTVIESGEAGNSTSQMLLRINSDVLDHNPDTVIVMGGTNDMINSGKLSTFSAYEANIRNIINQVQAANAEIILVTIPPCNEEELLKRHDAAAFEPDGPNGRVIKANVILAEIAADENLLLVDVYALINNNLSLLSSDGVHPSSDGLQAMSQLLVDGVIDNNLPTDTIVCFGDSITNLYTSYFETLLTQTPGEFEFLFDTDNDFEGWSNFGNPGTTSMAVTSGELQATYAATAGYLGIQHLANIEFSSTHPYVAIKIDHLPASRMSFYMASGWYNDDKNGFSSLSNTTLNNAGVYIYDLSTSGPGFGSGATQIFSGGGNYTDTNRVIFLIDDSDTSGTTNTTYNDIEWIKNFVSVQDIAEYVGLTLGVNDFQQDLISLYPNPVKDSFTITNSLGANAEIYDVVGKLMIKNKILSNTQFIDISDFNSGIYFIQIYNNGYTTSKKIIKK